MVTISSHIFTNIFPTEHITAVEWLMGYDRKYELYFDTESGKNKQINYSFF